MVTVNPVGGMTVTKWKKYTIDMGEISLINLLAGGGVGVTVYVILLFLKWNAKKKNETEEV